MAGICRFLYNIHKPSYISIFTDHLNLCDGANPFNVFYRKLCPFRLNCGSYSLYLYSCKPWNSCFLKGMDNLFCFVKTDKRLDPFLIQKMQLHFLTNAIFGQILRQSWLSKYSHTLRGMRRFCPASFSLSLAQILRLPRKIKSKCIFRVNPPFLAPIPSR